MVGLTRRGSPRRPHEKGTTMSRTTLTRRGLALAATAGLGLGLAGYGFAATGGGAEPASPTGPGTLGVQGTTTAPDGAAPPVAGDCPGHARGAAPGGSGSGT